MNVSIKAIAAAVSLAVVGGVQAAPVVDALGPNGGDVIVNIVGVNSGSQAESLVINTGITSDQFFPGSSFSFTSDPGLTSTISAFVGLYDDVRFWAAGAITDSFGFNRTTLNTGGPVADVPLFVTNAQVYYDKLNLGDLGAAPGNTVVVPFGDDEHYNNGDLTGFMNTGVGLDQDVAFRYQNVTFTGSAEEALNNWNLSSAGVLTYNAEVAPVPLPAAAWLMGSALMGVVAVGRRRSA